MGMIPQLFPFSLTVFLSFHSRVPGCVLNDISIFYVAMGTNKTFCLFVGSVKKKLIQIKRTLIKLLSHKFLCQKAKQDYMCTSRCCLAQMDI